MKRGEAMTEGERDLNILCCWPEDRGPLAKESRQSLEAGKGKEKSSTEIPKGTKPCRHLDLKPSKTRF